MSFIKKIHVRMDRHVQMYMYMDMDILYHRMIDCDRVPQWIFIRTLYWIGIVIVAHIEYYAFCMIFSISHSTALLIMAETITVTVRIIIYLMTTV